MQQYGKAARCYLAALRLNPDATHIWSYLRITFTCMERYDLVQKVSPAPRRTLLPVFDRPFCIDFCARFPLLQSEQRNIGLFDAEDTGTW